MDICISFDTTGSMYPVIGEVRRKTKEFVERIIKDIPNLRLSIVAHGDYCDEKTTYLMKYLDFTNDHQEIINFINNTGNTCGGDYPEAYEYVLNKIQSFSWMNDNRSFIIIGDAYPHEKHENPHDLDWRKEAEVVGKMGINIYSIQALDSGNAKSYTFYRQISEKTNGYHLHLHQFSHIVDILLAICYKQSGEDQLQNFEQEIQKKEYGMNRGIRNVFDIMFGRKTEKITYVDPKEDDVDDGEITPCPPAKYQVLTVDSSMPIKEFVMSKALSFKAGKGFYEFTKSEIIQPNKLVVLMKRDSGDLYEGKKARKLIGLTNESRRYKPSDLKEYRVFIQSTSYNRKLIAGTGFLYEADDWGK